MKHLRIGLIIALGLLALGLVLARVVVTVASGNNPEVQL